MLFNTFTFIFVFLPISFFGYFWVSRFAAELGIVYLTIASLFFYGYWDVRFVPLLLLSVVANYAIGNLIAFHEPKNRRLAKGILAAGVIANLACISYWKYTNWFVDVLDSLTGLHFAIGKIVLPIGISFYTFTQIAYLVDIYNKKCFERRFSSYFLFVTYFPHLIAGPILHHSEMMPQFADVLRKRICLSNVTLGLMLFLIGVIKKVVIADSVAPFADRVFDGSETLYTFEAWMGVLAYTVQIYFDFSGYTDMALGLSRMFNVTLPENFDSPYKATSIVDFWRRWHMTLSRFLRDYLYIPLGGNRKGVARRYFNLVATMVLGGVWHGAGWTFAIWGALHGAYLIVDHGIRNIKEKYNLPDSRWFAPVGQLVTFLAVIIAWVFFRATSLGSALSVLHAMWHWIPTPPAPEAEYASNLWGYVGNAAWFWIIGSLSLAFFAPNSKQIVARAEVRLEAVKGELRAVSLQTISGFFLTIIVFVISLSGMRHAVSPFIYFNF